MTMGERVEAEFISSDDDTVSGDFLPHWRERLQEIDITVRSFAAERPLMAFAAVVAAGYLLGRVLRKL
jgi:hypothetical protein